MSTSKSVCLALKEHVAEIYDSSAPRTALILGATGQTGRYLLQDLLASNRFTKVAEYGRRVTDKDQIKTGADKLEQKVIDFEKLSESGLKDGKWDVVFITCVIPACPAGSNLTDTFP